mgnify:CR=1 FL=1
MTEIAAAEGIDLGAEASLFRRPETRDLVADLGLDPVFPSREHSSQVLSHGRLQPIPRATIMGVPGDPDTVAELLGPATARDRDRLVRVLAELGTVAAAFYTVAYVGFGLPLVLASLATSMPVAIPLAVLAALCALLTVQQYRARL